MGKLKNEYSFIKDAPSFINEISINSPIQKETIFYKIKTVIIWKCQNCGIDYEMNFYDKVHRGRGKNGCKKCSLAVRGVEYSSNRARIINLTDIKPDIYRHLRKDNNNDPKDYPKTSPVKLKLICEMNHNFERPYVI